MAERVGFEPTDRVNGQRFSRPPHSTTLAPLRVWTSAILARSSPGKTSRCPSAPRADRTESERLNPHALIERPADSRAPQPSRWEGGTGGEGGIRTHGRVAPTHDFQSCTFGHSVTSPRDLNLELLLLQRTSSLAQVTEELPDQP